MAILFMLSVECGSNRTCATDIVGHFSSILSRLSDGTEITFSTIPLDGITQRDQEFWCCILPEGVSATGVTRRVSSPSLIVEVSKRMHAELRLFTGFRFALLGWESSSWLSWDDILSEKEEVGSLPLGLIVGSSLYRELGMPVKFERFGEDSWWIPLSDGDYQEIVRE